MVTGIPRKNRHGFSRTGVKKAPLTPAQKAQIKAKKKRELALFDELGRQQEAQFVQLAQDIGRPVDYVRMRFNRHVLAQRQKRKPTQFNAFLHKMAQEETRYSGRSKIADMARDEGLKAQFNALTEAEKKTLVDELNQHRFEKENAGHHLAKAQATDVDLVARDLQLKLTGAENRDDLHYMCILANRNPRAYQNTKLLYSSGVEEFTKAKFGILPEDLAVAFEAWSVGHLSGLSSRETPLALNKEARRVMRENWVAVVGTMKPVYNAHLALKKHSVEFVGWPSVPNFDAMNTVRDLKKLIAAVTSGDARWQKVPEDELEARIQELEARIDSGDVVLPQRKTRSDKGTTRPPRAPREPLAPVNAVTSAV